MVTITPPSHAAHR